MVFGRDPPELLWFEEESTANNELESLLKTRDMILRDAKEHLIKAQINHKESTSQKHFRELQFVVGYLVFLKLLPYRQTSLSKAFFQKLEPKFYGPFNVLERVGQAVYKLELPSYSKIHPVFHVSQLNPVLGRGHKVKTLPVLLEESEEFILQPEHLQGTRYDAEGHLEALVWKGLLVHESSWIRVKDIARKFPTFKLGDKLNITKGILIRAGDAIIGRDSGIRRREKSSWRKR